MSLILKMLHLFDNKKKREYTSDASQFLARYDRDFPSRSDSQKKEAQKHRNIFSRQTDAFKL
ncbi:CBU_0585 family protein [Facilibium subflavum]|uniref:CBU_0585 family protein n=1 Tax=Facilibium subflavum TaxID=2219058 RepID=UPI000E6570B1|nr:CBU_0585 family protein [Facilibium subflavum]